MSLYNDAESILITKEMIADRVRELGAELSRQYRDKNPLMICVLKGSVVFFSDLIRAMDIPLEIEFMAISSYGNSIRSSGEVKVVKDTDKSLENRHVILVEDIIDTGLTLSYIKNMLERRAPASLKICALLDKPDRLQVDIEADYVGFKIPNKFVIGYGLDYAQKYRNMPDVCVLNPKIYNRQP
ncbi:MAG: hypoxanthine phosphoribosyltransferase [Clostridiales bacterium]|jgi:hypoxanthine phosphoribosyltransferase|nr:hypoxanthine phosphoribosyltransferase [Clostridiales bacterium]